MQGFIAAVATEPPDADASTLAAARAYFDGSALPLIEDVRPRLP